MASLSDIRGFLVDLVFPLAEPLSREEIEAEERRKQDELNRGGDQIAALPKDPAILDGYLDKCLKLVEGEEDRRQGVESRLTTVMGLCSLAGTLVFGGIVVQATGTAHFQSSILRWCMGLGALYLTFQLCSAILAAVRGLARKVYHAGTSEVVLPNNGEEQAEHLKRHMRWCLETLADHRAQNNAKVTQMAVAHRAMTNFIAGLMLFALLGVGYAVRQNPGNSTVEMLRQNRELVDMIRGPQGPVGPQGSPGPPGPCSLPPEKQASPKRSN